MNIIFHLLKIWIHFEIKPWVCIHSMEDLGQELFTSHFFFFEVLFSDLSDGYQYACYKYHTRIYKPWSVKTWVCVFIERSQAAARTVLTHDRPLLPIELMSEWTDMLYKVHFMHIKELQVRMFCIGESWQQRGRSMAVKVRNGVSSLSNANSLCVNCDVGRLTTQLPFTQKF